LEIFGGAVILDDGAGWECRCRYRINERARRVSSRVIRLEVPTEARLDQAISGAVKSPSYACQASPIRVGIFFTRQPIGFCVHLWTGGSAERSPRCVHL